MLAKAIVNRVPQGLAIVNWTDSKALDIGPAFARENCWPMSLNGINKIRG